LSEISISFNLKLKLLIFHIPYFSGFQEFCPFYFRAARVIDIYSGRREGIMNLGKETFGDCKI